MATRNWFLTTAKALERPLHQAEFDRPATDSAPFFSRVQKASGKTGEGGIKAVSGTGPASEIGGMPGMKS
jgi:hypothetical protein